MLSLWLIPFDSNEATPLASHFTLDEAVEFLGDSNLVIAH